MYYANPEDWRSINNELYWIVKELLEEYMEVLTVLSTHTSMHLHIMLLIYMYR